jgi:hypothetical protein
MRVATTHLQVMRSMDALEQHCLTNEAEMHKFCQTDWQSAFDRYISAAPATEANAALLSRILALLANVISGSKNASMPVAALSWLAESTRKLLCVLYGESIAESSEMLASVALRELRCNILRLGIALLEEPRACNIWGAVASAQCIVALMPHLLMGRDVQTDRVYDL